MPLILYPSEKHIASVIFLHGLGGSADDWPLEIFENIKHPNIKYIFPNASKMPVTCNYGMVMNSWFDVIDLKPNAEQDKEGLKTASEILSKHIQNEIEIGILPEAIFIGGISQGGVVSLYTALKSPHKFAGIVALSTWLPTHAELEKELVSCENKFKTPILFCHGDKDRLVSLEWAHNTIKYIEELGFNRVNFKVYPGLAHYVSEQEKKDIQNFILEIFRTFP